MTVTVKKVTCEYADTFINTFDSAISHYSEWSDETLVSKRLGGIVTVFEDSVVNNPYSYPQCQELVALGVTELRHAIKGDFRIIYEVIERDDELKVFILLFLSQRQSIQHQLINHCLIYK